MILIAKSAGITTSGLNTDCQTCLEDLPAFIDQEAVDARAALRLYPHVWWHLWICQECAEIYRDTRALVAAQQSGIINPPSFPLPTVSLTRERFSVLHLTHQFLQKALLPLMPLMNAMRGPGSAGLILTERVDDAGREISVKVQKLTEEQCCLAIIVVPPPDGQLVLKIGEAHFRGQFDSEQLATIVTFPTALVKLPDGPDLVVDIEVNG